MLLFFIEIVLKSILVLITYLYFKALVYLKCKDNTFLIQQTIFEKFTDFLPQMALSFSRRAQTYSMIGKQQHGFNGLDGLTNVQSPLSQQNNPYPYAP